MTATPPQSDSPLVPGAHHPPRLARRPVPDARLMPAADPVRAPHHATPDADPVPGAHPPPRLTRRPVPHAHPFRLALRDTLALVALPLVAAFALPAAFAGGGTRRWFGGRAESQRAEAQTAKDAAAAAFYELDTAQRDLRISIETIMAVDDSPAARRAVSDFDALGRRIDEASQRYIDRRRRPRPRPGRPGGVGRRARAYRADRGQGRADRRQARAGPVRRRPRAAARQGGDAAGAAGPGGRAGPAGACSPRRTPSTSVRGVGARRRTTWRPGSPPSRPSSPGSTRAPDSTACRRPWSVPSGSRGRPRRCGRRPSGCRSGPPRSTAGWSRCGPAPRP